MIKIAQKVIKLIIVYNVKKIMLFCLKKIINVLNLKIILLKIAWNIMSKLVRQKILVK